MPGLALTVPNTLLDNAAADVVNPLRGQYENLLTPLFPQSNPVQNTYTAWPGAADSNVRIEWRQLQPRDPRAIPAGAADDEKYDFSVLDTAIAKVSEERQRLGFRVTSFNSCCRTSYPGNVDVSVPDWLASMPGATRAYLHDGVTYIVPEWNSPAYLRYFKELLAALGRRYDRDERISFFEMSGYGDFSENHVAFMRDTLGLPGSNADQSEEQLGYYAQYSDQFIGKAACDELVDANLAAFRHTQIIASLENPEIVKRLFRDSPVLASVARPVGIRADGLGTYDPIPVWAQDDSSHYVVDDDPIIDLMKNRYKIAPIVTEWIQKPESMPAKDYYLDGLRDVVNYHVSMTSSTGFPDQLSTTEMSPDDFMLWAKANKFSGYRYAVDGRADPENLRDGQSGSATIVITNFGSAPSYDDWAMRYDIVSGNGNTVMSLTGAASLRGLVADQLFGNPDGVPAPASISDTVQIPGLPPGHYSLRPRVVWEEHKPEGIHVVSMPDMNLAFPPRGSSVAQFSVQ